MSVSSQFGSSDAIRSVAGVVVRRSAVTRSSSSTLRQSASSRRRSAGAKSSGSVKSRKSCSAALSRPSSASRSRARGESVWLRAVSGRNRPSGSRSSSRRSFSSARCQACTRASASRCLSWWWLMAPSTQSCSSCASRVSSWPSVGPMMPRPSSSCARGDNRRPSARRRSTHGRWCPSSRPMAVGPSCSSSRSEQTTRASSSAVVVRRGALATSSRRLHCALDRAPSTTTGTVRWPCSRQRASRLRPSSTS